MKKYPAILIAVMLCGLILSGCSRNHTSRPTEPAIRYVTKVDVTCKKDQAALRWQYTDSEKMEAILLYLRTLRRSGTAQVDPQRVEGDHFEILLHYSDGSRRVYYQHADRYLSQDYKPWEQIDHKQAQDLYPLLESMPSDVL